MTDQELKDVLASLAVNLAEVAERSERSLEKSKEENDRGFRELREQMGRTDAKFGSFAEGMALPSLTKILYQRFGMDVVAPRVMARSNGHVLEVDALAWSKDKVFVVEVKSHPRLDSLDQMKRILKEVPEFFPEHRGKKVYGILAGVDLRRGTEQKILEEGIYLARIHDGHFELQVPDDFQPRAF
jgi:hypothetical protein